MPSSTSSSSLRCPPGPWIWTWACALVVALAALTALEVTWRAGGHVPSVVDTPALWAYHRARIDRAPDAPLVIVGRSRAQLGLSEGTLESTVDRTIVQLAVAGGGTPIPVLEDLAADANFRGIVLCEFDTHYIVGVAGRGQEEYVHYFHHDRRLNAEWDTCARALLQDQFVLLNPAVNLHTVATDLAKERRLPEADYVTTNFDRFRQADFAKANLDSERTLRGAQAREGFLENNAPVPDDWLKTTGRLEQAVDRIQERGGRVVFVRFPTSGDMLSLSERAYPKADYWDRFAAVTSAEMVHFLDVTALRGFNCPDLSHLDSRDAPRFTEELLNELRRRGIEL